jgi:glucose-6-phosphate 1-dehydrogenase
MVIQIEPEEGISLRFGAKVPDAVMSIGQVNMDFDYERYFGQSQNTGYERLLHACMIGDAILFQRADVVESVWRVIEPVIDVWKVPANSKFPELYSLRGD